jgi:hypothetical protein
MMHILRWTLAALAVLAATIAPAIAQSGWRPSNGEKLEFDVFRDGSKFGTHVVAFTKVGDQLTVDSDIELKVALGPLTLFHYVHDVTERYSAGRLISVAARTKKDGKLKNLSAHAVENGLKIVGATFDGVVQADAIPSTHWNVAEMRQAAMLSTETGAMLPITVIDQGLERVKVGAGEVEARKYLVKSELDANFWYDAFGRWVKCSFVAQGSKVDYVLRELPG